MDEGFRPLQNFLSKKEPGLQSLSPKNKGAG
jgi:hypothetical protein